MNTTPTKLLLATLFQNQHRASLDHAGLTAALSKVPVPTAENPEDPAPEDPHLVDRTRMQAQRDACQQTHDLCDRLVGQVLDALVATAADAVSHATAPASQTVTMARR